jgi:cholesterol oxidase
VGNALMAYVDFRGADARGPSLQDHFLLIESTIPAPLVGPVARAFAVYALARRSEFSDDQIRRSLLDLTAADDAHPDGALNHSTLYLASGHDDSGGRYVYRRDDRPRIVWPGASDSRGFETIHAEMSAFSTAQGAHFIVNPRTTLFGGRLMAPHPLGGCPMADDASHGVVDHAGRVFDPRGGFHPGLYVMDGSVIPRSLGSTPLLTICALAERASSVIAGELDRRRR